MEVSKKAGRGFLGNAFCGKRWDSRIKSANTTKKEMWLGYVLGPYGMLLTNSIVNSYFNQYLTDVLGFTIAKGAWIAGFMILFPVISKLIDAVTNIIMGKILDSTACRQGKVRPWFLISAPLVVVSVIMMFSMPFANVYAQAAWVVIAFNLYYSVAYTMWNMAKELSAALSTRNVRQRRNNAMAANITMQIGTGIVSILFPTILTGVCAAVNGDNAKGYFLCMSMVACVALPLTFLQYFYTKERVTEERRSQNGIAGAGESGYVAIKEATFMEQMKACLKDRYWIIFMLVILIYNVAGNLRNFALVYYSGWVVNGNAYGNYAAIQAKFQMIAMSPMGPGLLIALPLMKKYGRSRCLWVGATFTIIGSVLAFVSVGNGTMIYAGTALAAIGNIPAAYMLLSFLGDVIDHTEWKMGLRCDGFSSSVYGATTMFAVGIAQGIFNLGLMASGYMQPETIGTAANGIALYADQPAAATSWINMAYQGGHIILGFVILIVFCAVFKLEDKMPEVSKGLQERRVEECRKKGIEYIPADEMERREIEEQERKAEEERIKELKERCIRRGRDFETENAKVLKKREEKRARAEAKAAKTANKKG